MTWSTCRNMTSLETYGSWKCLASVYYAVSVRQIPWIKDMHGMLVIIMKLLKSTRACLFMLFLDSTCLWQLKLFIVWSRKFIIISSLHLSDSRHLKEVIILKLLLTWRMTGEKLYRKNSKQWYLFPILHGFDAGAFLVNPISRSTNEFGLTKLKDLSSVRRSRRSWRCLYRQILRKLSASGFQSINGSGFGALYQTLWPIFFF